MHYLAPSRERAHVVCFYRNFLREGPNYCHVGLGVNALHTVRVLRRHHVRADAEGVRQPDEVAVKLRETPSVTHALIEAPWISTPKLGALLAEFPHVHFLVRLHSQIGFLQVEPGAVQLLREGLVLQESALNLTIAANSERLCTFVERSYHGRCLHLPNLYDLERIRVRPREAHDHRTLRISSFGALRLLKNHATAAAAAMLIAEQRGADLEFHVSVNREEHGKGVLQTLRNMMAGVRWAKLVEVPWEPWPQFRRTVGHMDLCLQPSFTETFNITTADACAEGVPAVVSSAIEWAPPSWMADVDSAEDVARVGGHLLSNRHAGLEGRHALERFCDQGERRWLSYLGGPPSVHHVSC